MLKNLLGKDGEKKEIDEEELKKLRQQFKELAEEHNVPSNNTSQNQQNAQPQQGTASPNTQGGNLPQDNSANQQQQQTQQYVDPERLEENERITNLIMQQIKELIEIDNNLNVKIKEIETKLKNNISQTQDVKNVVDKFHQRLEFIEKNMEKFMGLYEVVTNRFNPFVEEEQKEKMENPEARGEVNIPDVGLDQEKEEQQNSSQTQESKQTETQSASNAQSQPQPQQEQPKQAEEKEEASEAERKFQEEKEASAPQQQPQQEQATQNNESSEGRNIMVEAGVKGKLDQEAENHAIQRLEDLSKGIGDNKQARLKVVDRIAKGINKLVVDAIKTHSKVSKEQVDNLMDEIAGEVGVSGNTNTSGSVPYQQDSSAQEQPEEPQKQEQPSEIKEEVQPEMEGTPQRNQQTPQQDSLKVEDNTTGQEESSPEQSQGQSEETQSNEESKEEGKQIQSGNNETPIEEPSQQQTDTQADTQGQPRDESISKKEVSSDLHFKLLDGTEIKSVADLREGLKTMDEKEFFQHVTEEGNDFGLWVGLALNDQEVGENLSKIKDKQELISELEKID